MITSKHNCKYCGEPVGIKKSPKGKIDECDNCSDFYYKDEPDIKHKGIQDVEGEVHLLKDNETKDKYKKATLKENKKETLW